MKIGILSDTHDHIGHIEQAMERFLALGVELVVHAGDIVSPPALRRMKGIKIAGVYGNNDGEKLGLARAFESLGGLLKGDFLEMELEGEKVAVYHGTVPAIKESLVHGGLYRVVITGHTHATENRMVGNTLALNPGTAHGFGKTATIMVLDTDGWKAEVLDLT
ncbi:MAG: metallophosphoesterase [Magnetococcales bacterium]|nr:metallophosphoesterase [Magnetococcales bacterium]